jgi:tetratricopeptide (TPR) repeat protein
MGRYIVLEQIGAGGMGMVYSAYDPDLQRRLALKVMHVSGSGPTGDDGRRSRLLREAQAMARLSHPNVVTVHDVGRIGDDVFIAMELVDGVALSQWLVDEERSWRDVVRAFVQAGQGLQSAHAAGLVHRDFKPDNVLVSHDGRVLVTDFGIARVDDRPADHSEVSAEITHEQERTGSQLGVVIGTPAYMSPEQHLRQPLDARSDQFSFCVSLWEGLFGERPFKGESLAALGLAVTEGDPPTPPADTDVPPKIRAAVLRGLARDPAERHASMEELLAILGKSQSPSRRWVLPILLPVAAAGITAAAMASRTQEPCTEGDELVAPAWSDGARTQLEEAWAGKGRYAADALPTVLTALDGHRTEWVDAYRSSCEATKVREEQSDRAFDLSMACLRTRRAEMQAAVELLATAEQDVIVRGLDISAGLGDIDACLDAEALGRLDPVPDDPQSRELLEQIDAAIGRSETLLDAGKYAESLEAAELAWGLAQQVDYRPIQADAEFRRAVATWLNGSIDDGLQQMMHAHFLASGSRHDIRAARTAGEILYILTDDKARYDEAETWYRHGEAALQRLGRKAEDDARLTGNLGILRQSQGRFDEAIELYERALQLHQKQYGEVSIAVANNINDLALVYEIQGKYDKAVQYHRRAMAIREQLGGPRHPEVAASHNNIGLALRNQGKTVEAVKHWELAVEIDTEVFGPDNIALASALNNLGSGLDNLDRLEEAKAAYERALALRLKHLPPGHPDTASIYKNLALNAAARDEYEEAKGYFEKALGMLEASLGPDHPYVGEVLYRLGELHCRADHCELGKPMLQRALALFQKAFPDGHLFVAAVMRDLGRVEQAEGDFDEAERRYQESIALEDRLVGPEHPERLLTTLRLSQLREEQGRFADARELLAGIIEVREKNPEEYGATVARNLIHLAELDARLGQSERAKDELERAASMSEGHDWPDVAEHLSRAQSELSK